jgi:hypothetical protein
MVLLLTKLISADQNYGISIAATTLGLIKFISNVSVIKSAPHIEMTLIRACSSFKVPGSPHQGEW